MLLFKYLPGILGRIDRVVQVPIPLREAGRYGLVDVDPDHPLSRNDRRRVRGTPYTHILDTLFQENGLNDTLLESLLILHGPFS